MILGKIIYFYRFIHFEYALMQQALVTEVTRSNTLTTEGGV